jgi:ATP-dependent RNA helicase RhlE
LRDIERGGILVGTPGRLLDFHRGGKLNLNSVQYLVLDEVDRMLDMGFLPDIENICRAVSPKRQTMLFSATLPPSIQEIALRHSYDPLEINAVGDAKVVETVQQSVVMTRGEEKLNVLMDLLKWIFEQGDARLLIFTNTKLYADRLTEVLNEIGHPAHALHGDLRFNTRQMNLNSFKSGNVRILVATDVASRGLDIKGITHVINFDVTNTPDDYVHRIGRTGRAGESGMAVTLVASDKIVEKKRLSEIESMVGSRLPKFNKKLLQPAIETPLVI